MQTPARRMAPGRPGTRVADRITPHTACFGNAALGLLCVVGLVTMTGCGTDVRGKSSDVTVVPKACDATTENTSTPCQENTDCCPGASCQNGTCQASACVPGSAKCNEQVLSICTDDGGGLSTFNCAPWLCEDGRCTGCEPDSVKCIVGNLHRCEADGSGYVLEEDCPLDAQCVNNQCLTCYPDQGKCEGLETYRCNAEGSAWEFIGTCQAGETCFSGFCQSLCSNDIKYNTNVGCDYWAVDLDHYFNFKEAQNTPYAVIVSNLSEATATVTVTARDGPEAEITQVAQHVVEPGALHIFDLPQRHPGGTKIAWKSYRIESTTPIVAYQFNPLENVGVYSNDASLLLPSNSFGKEYYVVSRPELVGGGPTLEEGDNCEQICWSLPGGTCETYVDTEYCLVPYRGAITVVASTPDTQVTLVPTGRSQAGDQVPAMEPGQEYSFTLQPYQVLNIKTDATGADLTGTRITATKPVAVFSGHESTNTGDVCCTDHLEQQLIPVRSWGKDVIATKSQARGIEGDYFRILAAEDDTTLQFEPAVHPVASLNSGGWLEIQTTQDFRVTANRPILVAQILASSEETLTSEPWGLCGSDQDCHTGYSCLPYEGQSICYPPSCSVASDCPDGHTCECLPGYDCYCRPIGDPALILLAPTEQFRDEYVFLTPNKYIQDYINIIAPTAATVYLDNSVVSDEKFIAVGSSGYRVARIGVSDGVHRLNSTAPISLVVYGYDADVSYGYVGGLNLDEL